MSASVLSAKSSTGLLPDSLVQWTRESAEQFLNELVFPKMTDEAWRKFPLGQLDLATLNKNPFQLEVVEISKETNPSDLRIGTAKSILASILNSAKDNYFALYTLKQTHQIYFYELGEDGTEREFYDFQCKLRDNQNGNIVILVSVAANTKAKFRESYHSISQTDQLHILHSLSCYHLKEGSSLDILVEEEYDENLFHFRFIYSFQEKESNLNIHSFPRGGYRGKQFYLPELNGMGSTYKLMGVSSLVNRELLDIDAKVTHLADHTTSKISYKAIVNDRSHHIFTGNLAIPSNVKKVSAHQESHNLSLNKKARAEANPKLEVMAEDVSCTHGATVGDIDEEQLFYLLSRGLTPSEAKSLLVAAFYEETVSKIPFPETVKLNISNNIRKSVLGS